MAMRCISTCACPCVSTGIDLRLLRMRLLRLLRLRRRRRRRRSWWLWGGPAVALPRCLG